MVNDPDTRYQQNELALAVLVAKILILEKAVALLFGAGFYQHRDPVSGLAAYEELLGLRVSEVCESLPSSVRPDAEEAARATLKTLFDEGQLFVDQMLRERAKQHSSTRPE